MCLTNTSPGATLYMSRTARFACCESLREFTSTLFNRTQQHCAPFLTLAFIQILSASCAHAAPQTVRSSQPQTSPPAVTVNFTPAYNFNSVNVGASSSSTSVTFTFVSPGSIAAPVVVTQGAAELDFTDAGTGSCTTNGTGHAYNAGDTCIVNVTFTPKSWGPRYGAIELQDTSGNPIATVYLQGIGVGPQVSFPPGVPSPLPLPGLTATLNAIAIDGQGNLYLAENIAPYSGSSMVIKETWANGAWTQSTVMSGLDQPLGIAVDGAGKVYVADVSSYQPYVATPIPTGGYTKSLLDQPVTGFRIAAIAVDGAGNIYIADEVQGLQKIAYQGAAGYTYTWSAIDNTIYSVSLAVDTAGNIYLAGLAPTSGGIGTPGLFKETVSNGIYTQSMIDGSSFESVGLDGNGNVFGSNGGQLVKETLSNGTYTQSAIDFPTLGRGFVFDPQGNVIAADSVSTVSKLDLSDGPGISFATTAYGSTSADSPKTVTLTNAGNGALNIPVPSSGDNPSISPSFTVDDSVTSPCHFVAAGSSSPGTLLEGVSCDFFISFRPQSGGPISGSLVLTDSGLNQTASDYITQTISLSGTGTAGPAPITWATPSAIALGTPLGSAQLNATSTAAGTFTYSPAAGTVPGVGTQTLTTSFTPTDTTTYTANTASVSLKVEDFTLASENGGSATASPGGQAAYTLAVSTPSGDPFPQAITFAVTGLPSGATATFSPSTVAAGFSATNVTMTVTVSNSAAIHSRPFPFGTGVLPLALGLILLPFGRMQRKSSQRFFRLVCITIGSTALFGVLACSSGGGGGSKSTPTPQSYSLTVTAASGSLSHSTTLNLTVN
jgi:hypothetical protein